MLKSHESMMENHWVLCRMITRMVKRLHYIGIDLRLLHSGQLGTTLDDSYDADYRAH